MKSVSLIPAEVRALRGGVVPNNVLALAAIIFALLLGGGYYLYALHQETTTNKLSAQNSAKALPALSASVNDLSIRATTLNGADVNELSKLVREVVQARPQWPQTLTSIYAAAGANVQILTMNAQMHSSTATATSTAAFDVNITGTAPDNTAVAAFIRNLRQIPVVVDATLLSSSEAQATAGGRSMISFSAGLGLKPTKSSPLVDQAINGGSGSSAPGAGGTP